jgi:UDP-sulfoquinovose synthase
MRDTKACMQTQVNNVAGTLSLLWAMREHCPEAHLLKLGTMGEYGTPNCDIPEGEIPDDCVAKYRRCDDFDYIQNCPMSGLPFPRSPGSFYHLSKVHDTHNIIFACKTWGLRSTDIMQGVVFGVTINDNTNPSQLTRFDYDEYFGTVINRFCTQAIIKHHLTIYGGGNQTRGYLPLKDSIQCLTLAIENPPSQGEYRVFNQFENIYSINQLADLVISASEQFNLYPHKMHLPNPRTEADKHYYKPSHQRLFDLGYIPTTDIKSEIIKLFNDLIPHKDRIIKEHIMPTTTWR